MNPKKPRNKCRNCREECGRSSSFYCSFKCQHAYQWANKVHIFEEIGKWSGANSEVSIRRNTKRYLIETVGHRCKICGRDTWEGQPIPLIMDHIDGDSENSGIENCRLVCGNCDMQLPTYKGKNKGKGRATRRQRYVEGKSY